MEQHFSERIQQVQEEFAREISDTTELMKTAHKKELGSSSLLQNLFPNNAIFFRGNLF